MKAGGPRMNDLDRSPSLAHLVAMVTAKPTPHCCKSVETWRQTNANVGHSLCSDTHTVRDQLRRIANN